MSRVGDFHYDENSFPLLQPPPGYAYIITLAEPLSYPSGPSHVLYVGKAGDIGRGFTSMGEQLAWAYSGNRKGFDNPTRVASLHVIRATRRASKEDLERALLWVFIFTYGASPQGNIQDVAFTDPQMAQFEHDCGITRAYLVELLKSIG